MVDLAVVSEGVDRLVIVSGQGDGTFGPPLDLATGDGPLGLSAAELVGDANLDLVTADNFADRISIFPGPGAAFGPPVSFPAGYSPVPWPRGTWKATAISTWWWASGAANSPRCC